MTSAVARPGRDLPPYRVRAVNGATQSENKIHDDTVAKQYGFTGGLVPGVTTFAHMARPLVEFYGREFLAGGHLEGRFLKPVYEGDLVTVRCRLEEQAGRDVVAIEVVNEEGTICAVGSGWYRPEDVMQEGEDLVSRFSEAPLPDSRPAASPEVFERTPVLGSIHAVYEADDARAALLAELGDELPLWHAADAPSHPGYLIRFANSVLVQNVRLGPWMHVESRATFMSEAAPGEHLSTRANVVAVFEKKGHSFVELDVLTVAGDRPVMAARHVAIYEPRRIAD